ncbi:arylmalonate decarboxylase [Streptomyces sp. C10-9-1]|uniref:maleate cis-trans isomerase family protein n=1 Tax=Streptomyces sp. C10-9-1 TaxID=1859285 RepID=UPI0021117024|nr:arylmalonate decarboxylase [Streptomyces sp. C10-9-1]MCQ6554502.1 arylmalonate decarboxylase [Streptomyces sp. C10-9-1]
MELFSLPRIGIVVPPENPTAEPEFNRLLDCRLNVFTSRFPVTPDMGLREMLETYNRVLPDTLGAFGRMRLDGAVVACSASHYLLAPEGDRALCDELSARAGYPVQSSTQATLAACEALGVTRLTLVSPYQPWLTETSRDFWERAGLRVDAVVRVPAARGADGSELHDPYRVTAQAIRDRLRGRRLTDGSAVLFTGTGMGTLTVLGELAGQDASRVLLSSNLASAWWARRLAGDRSEAAHPLVRRLDAQAR